MGKIIYVTGGARSGKSSFAERYILDSKTEKKFYVATSLAFDDEMKNRIEKHQEQRGDGWITIEAYRDIVSHLKKNYTQEKTIILLDCLTNLVTNQMIMDREIHWDKVSKEVLKKIEMEISEEVTQILNYIKKSKEDIVIVSNEVGMGIVPINALARHFRDIAGRMNRLVAEHSDEAYLIVSGLKIKLK